MKNIFITLLMGSTLFMSQNGNAHLDAASDEALRKTQNVLVDRVEREKIKSKDASLQKVDKDLESLVGKDGNKDAVYEAASKILNDLAQDTNGDPDKMQAIMQEAQKDPKAFYLKYISTKNKENIRGIAEDIEKIKVDSKQP